MAIVEPEPTNALRAQKRGGRKKKYGGKTCFILYAESLIVGNRFHFSVCPILLACS